MSIFFYRVSPHVYHVCVDTLECECTACALGVAIEAMWHILTEGVQ